MIPYRCAVDVEGVDAIDFHTHVEIDSAGRCAYDPELAEATTRYFNLGPDAATRIDDLAALYRAHNTAAVVFTIDAHCLGPSAQLGGGVDRGCGPQQ